MPKLLKVLAEPHPFLREIASPVPNEAFGTDALHTFVENMKYTMKKEDGIGLAAPQVHEDMRLIVIETKDGTMEFINPEITFTSNKKDLGEEGCLSVPGEFGMVERFDHIKVTSYDADGNEHEHDARGLFARVLQHEIDHLNGILFIDKLEEFDKNELPEVTPAI